ncbi:iron-siderophore ABC transporter substrate-binding protein [Cellulomonas sp. PhB143]|uniref:iron-siderophore ABC transporter substrate-binding protein n=1 Tax=Cellulomonas sp. PhB143 TaxID=2485186 RepID=UPI000F9C1A9B|nr:iron-siderophore ABC transporter substrate-binding protein [Cellulomonas sp. PhB143]ROS75563.1 iron complex transport system substrate-binding protein [Cellulomonas sp. PhB143]
MLSTRRKAAALAAGLAAVLALAGCSSSGSSDAGASPSSGSSASDDAFPVTIEHALGTTEIPAKPERVVTWGWGSSDAAIALGVVPVAMSYQAYGGDKDGVLPWVKDALDKAGEKTPVVLPNQQEVPVQDIAAQKPDLILANYSGITQDEYDLLSKIAPTVAYPDKPWSTPWRDVVTGVGTALGMDDQAATLIDDTEATISEAADAHPELAGKTVASVWDTGDTFYVYTADDPRQQFLEDLGLKTAPSVGELATGESSFYYTLSYEQLDQLKSDMLVSFADDQKTEDAVLAKDALQVMPQVKSGAVAQIVGTDLVAAVSPPTVLSLPWGLDDYLDALSAAAAKVG